MNALVYVDKGNHEYLQNEKLKKKTTPNKNT